MFHPVLLPCVFVENGTSLQMSIFPCVNPADSFKNSCKRICKVLSGGWLPEF